MTTSNLFLRDDATWAAPGGGGGDFVVSRVVLSPADIVIINGGDGITIVPGVDDKIVYPMSYAVVYVPGADVYDSAVWIADFRYGADGVLAASTQQIDLTGTGVYTTGVFDVFQNQDTGQLLGEDIVIQSSVPLTPTGADPGNIVVVVVSFVVDPT